MKTGLHATITTAPFAGVVPRMVDRGATNGAPCLGLALALGGAIWLGGASILTLLAG